MDARVNILSSPADHITIMPVSVFIAGPHQVNFKQTAVRQMSFSSVGSRKSCHL